jgi:trimethylamine--corrinoid protein Co-methyltransferase
MSSDHDLVGIRSSLYKPLNANDVTRMATAVFEVLEKSGVAVYSDEGFEAFAKAGAEVDRETRNVKLSRSLVEDCIDSNPSTITLHARDGKYDAVLEKDRVHYGTGGTAIFVLDPDTGERRPSTVTDVILNARMVNALENIHVFTINVFPNEIEDQNHIDVNRFFHALDNTTKHVMGGIYSAQGCRNVVKMAEEIAGGGDALRAQPFVSFITLIISPFKIDKIYGDMTCYLAREGLPVVVPTEPIAGSTSPVTWIISAGRSSAPWSMRHRRRWRSTSGFRCTPPAAPPTPRRSIPSALTRPPCRAYWRPCPAPTTSTISLVSWSPTCRCPTRSWSSTTRSSG